MRAITKVYTAFRSAGVPETEAMEAALGEDNLATKSDINELNISLAKLDSKLNILLAITFLAIIAPAIRDLLHGIN